MQSAVFQRPFCPSVCLSVKHMHCDKTKHLFAHILSPYERTFILVFRHEEWLVRTTLVREILGQTGPVKAKTLIFNRYSFVAPQP